MEAIRCSAFQCLIHFKMNNFRMSHTGKHTQVSVRGFLWFGESLGMPTAPQQLQPPLPQGWWDVNLALQG